MKEELLFKIAITKIPKIGPVIARSLISYCGSPKAVFLEKARFLKSIPGVGEKLARIIKNSNALKSAELELRFVQKNNLDVRFYLDNNYPTRLKALDSSPLLIYTKGSAELNAPRTVAIIGTRNPSSYGKEITRRLVQELSVYKPLVISGLAFGIDAVAHNSSLDFNLDTIAVLGHGLDRIYPNQHRSLAAKIIKHGALITEFSSGTLPDRENFPMRNRIVAGLSDAVIVVESGLNGGSMITAGFANQYNTDVFSFPGSIYNESSKGCHLLLKKHMATLVENAEDIAWNLKWERKNKNTIYQPSLFCDLEPDEKRIIELIKENEVVSQDHLQFKLRFIHSKLNTLLLSLELKDMIISLPGNQFSLKYH